MTECQVKGVFEMPHELELISEEKMPSLYSLSSFTNSICSDSTIDLDELDQIDSTLLESVKPIHEKRGSQPLKNNFLSEKSLEQCLDERPNGTKTPEPSIKPVKQSHLAFSKSVSLHDVSNILPLSLPAKSNTVSCETINSHSLSSTTKSKDSGFHRSLSCLSLTSGKRSYDHVQSKVKAYIKNIKDSEALNKKNKRLQNQEKTTEPTLVNDSEGVVGKDDLIKEIQELKHELHEKSLYIDAQQRNYNKLLLKFAEAREIIDKLRVQSMSFNYSDGVNPASESPSIGLSNIKFDSIGFKLSKNFNHLGSCITEENSVEDEAFVSAETTNEIVLEDFKPRSHSSPKEKSLSPVKKMFSSSSCLRKNYKPLTNPSQNNPPNRNPQIQNSYKEQASFDSCNVVLNSSFKLNNHLNLSQRQSMSIDLPNDDPFDKVKKWQASLPSINLLGSYSSSECEGTDQDSTHSAAASHCHSRRSESDPLSCCLVKAKANESEICNILSQELQNKCIITEVDVVIERSLCQSKNNENVSKSHSEKRLNTFVTSKKTTVEEGKSLFINNKCSASKSRQKLPAKTQNKINKPLNCTIRRNSVEVTLFPSELECKNTHCSPLRSRESSASEGGSTHLPKSSSISNCRVNKTYNEDENSDDSSSISSSVLGSDLSSTRSPKTAKRRLVLCENIVSNKVPKITKSKSSQTTFTLKEPKLQFTPSFENIGTQMNNQISPKHKSTNYDTWFKHRSSNSSLKTESSQRKAWNARNNANFYVCKDFLFNKSTSLMECIQDMEGLVSKGTLVIRSVMGRNNTSC